MVEDDAVDIVVVTTTPATHFEFTKLALENGKHDRRYDTDFLTLRCLLASRSLGRIVEFESHFDRYKPLLSNAKPWKTTPQPGGGAIYDLGAHLIDQIVQLFGLPKRITGFVGSQRENGGGEGGYEDSCTVLMHYKGGMMATVKVAVVSMEERQLRFWVRGVGGSYKKYDEDPQESHLTSGMRPGDSGFGIEPEDHYGILTTSQESTMTSAPYPTVQPAADTDTTYKAIYTHLAAAVAGKGDVAVKAEEARDVIWLIEAARRSSEEGRTVDV
ncbi:MAG: hypothetical protein Q9169_007413 [Polycauliona sp. 2 TL-2023]